MKAFPTDLYGQAIFVANLYSDDEIVSALQLAEHNIDAHINEDTGVSVLHMAVARDNNVLIDLMLKAGADIEARSLFGLTPLHSAILCGHLKAVLTLLDAGADIEAIDNWYKTSLHNAIEVQQEEIVKVLLDRGAIVDRRDIWGVSTIERVHHMSVNLDANQTIYELVIEHAEKQLGISDDGPSL